MVNAIRMMLRVYLMKIYTGNPLSSVEEIENFSSLIALWLIDNQFRSLAIIDSLSQFLLRLYHFLEIKLRTRTILVLKFISRGSALYELVDEMVSLQVQTGPEQIHQDHYSRTHPRKISSATTRYRRSCCCCYGLIETLTFIALGLIAILGLLARGFHQDRRSYRDSRNR